MKCQQLLARKGKLICLCFFLLCFHAINSFSQTTTIAYSGSGLSETACNVFSGAPKVSNILHYICSGGATFDGTNVKLTTGEDANSRVAGTAYIIGFEFLQVLNTAFRSLPPA